MKYTRFQDIPKFTREGSYTVDVHWIAIERTLADFKKTQGLDLDPDFQRAHVWTLDQKVRFVEFAMRGGRSANVIHFNCPEWPHSRKVHGPIQLVDGKQRLEAVRQFMRDEFRAFGSLYSEFTDSPRLHDTKFTFNINDLKTRAEVLQWYLDFNSGGVVHTEEELQRVRDLLSQPAKGGMDGR